MGPVNSRRKFVALLCLPIGFQIGRFSWLNLLKPDTPQDLPKDLFVVAYQTNFGGMSLSSDQFQNLRNTYCDSAAVDRLIAECKVHGRIQKDAVVFNELENVWVVAFRSVADFQFFQTSVSAKNRMFDRSRLNDLGFLRIVTAIDAGEVPIENIDLKDLYSRRQSLACNDVRTGLDGKISFSPV